MLIKPTDFKSTACPVYVNDDIFEASIKGIFASHHLDSK